MHNNYFQEDNFIKSFVERVLLNQNGFEKPKEAHIEIFKKAQQIFAGILFKDKKEYDDFADKLFIKKVVRGQTKSLNRISEVKDKIDNNIAASLKRIDEGFENKYKDTDTFVRDCLKLSEQLAEVFGMIESKEDISWFFLPSANPLFQMIKLDRDEANKINDHVQIMAQNFKAIANRKLWSEILSDKTSAILGINKQQNMQLEKIKKETNYVQKALDYILHKVRPRGNRQRPATNGEMLKYFIKSLKARFELPKEKKDSKELQSFINKIVFDSEDETEQQKKKRRSDARRDFIKEKFDFYQQDKKKSKKVEKKVEQEQRDMIEILRDKVTESALDFDPVQHRAILDQILFSLLNSMNRAVGDDIFFLDGIHSLWQDDPITVERVVEYYLNSGVIELIRNYFYYTGANDGTDKDKPVIFQDVFKPAFLNFMNNYDFGEHGSWNEGLFKDWELVLKESLFMEELRYNGPLYIENIVQKTSILNENNGETWRRFMNQFIRQFYVGAYLQRILDWYEDRVADGRADLYHEKQAENLPMYFFHWFESTQIFEDLEKVGQRIGYVDFDQMQQLNLDWIMHHQADEDEWLRMQRAFPHFEGIKNFIQNVLLILNKNMNAGSTNLFERIVEHTDKNQWLKDIACNFIFKYMTQSCNYRLNMYFEQRNRNEIFKMDAVQQKFTKFRGQKKETHWTSIDFEQTTIFKLDNNFRLLTSAVQLQQQQYEKNRQKIFKVDSDVFMQSHILLRQMESFVDHSNFLMSSGFNFNSVLKMSKYLTYVINYLIHESKEHGKYFQQESKFRFLLLMGFQPVRIRTSQLNNKGKKNKVEEDLFNYFRIYKHDTLAADFLTLTLMQFQIERQKQIADFMQFRAGGVDRLLEQSVTQRKVFNIYEGKVYTTQQYPEEKGVNMKEFNRRIQIARRKYNAGVGLKNTETQALAISDFGQQVNFRNEQLLGELNDSAGYQMQLINGNTKYLAMPLGFAQKRKDRMYKEVLRLEIQNMKKQYKSANENGKLTEDQQREIEKYQKLLILSGNKNERHRLFDGDQLLKFRIGEEKGFDLSRDNAFMVFDSSFSNILVRNMLSLKGLPIFYKNQFSLGSGDYESQIKQLARIKKEEAKDGKPQTGFLRNQALKEILDGFMVQLNKDLLTGGFARTQQRAIDPDKKVNYVLLKLVLKVPQYQQTVGSIENGQSNKETLLLVDCSNWQYITFQTIYRTGDTEWSLMDKIVEFMLFRATHENYDIGAEDAGDLETQDAMEGLESDYDADDVQHPDDDEEIEGVDKLVRNPNTQIQNQTAVVDGDIKSFKPYYRQSRASKTLQSLLSNPDEKNVFLNSNYLNAILVSITASMIRKNQITESIGTLRQSFDRLVKFEEEEREKQLRSSKKNNNNNSKIQNKNTKKQNEDREESKQQQVQYQQNDGGAYNNNKVSDFARGLIKKRQAIQYSDGEFSGSDDEAQGRARNLPISNRKKSNDGGGGRGFLKKHTYESEAQIILQNELYQKFDVNINKKFDPFQNQIFYCGFAVQHFIDSMIQFGKDQKEFDIIMNHQQQEQNNNNKIKEDYDTLQEVINIFNNQIAELSTENPNYLEEKNTSMNEQTLVQNILKSLTDNAPNVVVAFIYVTMENHLNQFNYLILDIVQAPNRSQLLMLKDLQQGVKDSKYQSHEFMNDYRSKIELRLPIIDKIDFFVGVEADHVYLIDKNMIKKFIKYTNQHYIRPQISQKLRDQSIQQIIKRLSKQFGEDVANIIAEQIQHNEAQKSEFGIVYPQFIQINEHQQQKKIAESIELIQQRQEEEFRLKALNESKKVSSEVDQQKRATKLKQLQQVIQAEYKKIERIQNMYEDQNKGLHRRKFPQAISASQKIKLTQWDKAIGAFDIETTSEINKVMTPFLICCVIEFPAMTIDIVEKKKQKQKAKQSKGRKKKNINNNNKKERRRRRIQAFEEEDIEQSSSSSEEELYSMVAEEDEEEAAADDIPQIILDMEEDKKKEEAEQEDSEIKVVRSIKLEARREKISFTNDHAQMKDVKVCCLFKFVSFLHHFQESLWFEIKKHFILNSDDEDLNNRERELFLTNLRSIKRRIEVTLFGWNSSGFDLPLIIPYLLLFDNSYILNLVGEISRVKFLKFGIFKFQDLFLTIGGKLEDACRSFGLQQSQGKIAEFNIAQYDTLEKLQQNFKNIEEYCFRDVEATFQINVKLNESINQLLPDIQQKMIERLKLHELFATEDERKKLDSMLSQFNITQINNSFVASTVSSLSELIFNVQGEGFAKIGEFYFGRDKYKKKNVNNNYNGYDFYYRGTISKTQHLKEKKSYRGGLTNVLGYEKVEEGYCFDFNSLYPFIIANHLKPTQFSHVNEWMTTVNIKKILQNTDPESNAIIGQQFWTDMQREQMQKFLNPGRYKSTNLYGIAYYEFFEDTFVPFTQRRQIKKSDIGNYQFRIFNADVERKIANSESYNEPDCLTYIWGIEIIQLLEKKCLKHLIIREESVYNTHDPDYDVYGTLIRILYESRIQARLEKKEAAQMLMKLIMNSSYGKKAQRNFKQSYIMTADQWEIFQKDQIIQHCGDAEAFYKRIINIEIMQTVLDTDSGLLDIIDDERRVKFFDQQERCKAGRLKLKSVQEIEEALDRFKASHIDLKLPCLRITLEAQEYQPKDFGSHTFLASFITAGGRARFTEAVLAAGISNNKTFRTRYGDTDSFFVDREGGENLMASGLVDENKLGFLKNELGEGVRFIEFQAFASKCYYLKYMDPKNPGKEKYKTAFKGVRKDKKLGYHNLALYEQLKKNGYAVQDKVDRVIFRKKNIGSIRIEQAGVDCDPKCKSLVSPIGSVSFFTGERDVEKFGGRLLRNEKNEFYQTCEKEYYDFMRKRFDNNIQKKKEEVSASSINNNQQQQPY